MSAFRYRLVWVLVSFGRHARRRVKDRCDSVLVHSESPASQRHRLLPHSKLVRRFKVPSHCFSQCQAAGDIPTYPGPNSGAGAGETIRLS